MPLILQRTVSTNFEYSTQVIFSILRYLVICVCSALGICFCYDCSAYRTCLAMIGGYTVQHTAYSLHLLLSIALHSAFSLNVSNINVQLFMTLLVYFPTYFFLYRVFIRKINTIVDELRSWNLLLLSMGVLMNVLIISDAMRYISPVQNVLLRILSVFNCMILLTMLSMEGGKTQNEASENSRLFTERAADTDLSYVRPGRERAQRGREGVLHAPVQVGFFYSTDDTKEIRNTPVEQQGTVEELTYECPAYAYNEILGVDETVSKRLLVYLPYNYDPSLQYNILYLMHGGRETENYWLGTAERLHGEADCNLLDYMIMNGLCDPCIVVTPTYYTRVEGLEVTDAQAKSFAAELGDENLGSEEALHTWFFQYVIMKCRSCQ